MSAIVAAKSENSPAFADVWNAIASRAEALKLRPGDQLPSVRDLAEQLGVKTTLVRDALLQAQAKGAVRIAPRVGAFLEVTPTAARTVVNEPAAAVGSALEGAFAREQHNVLHLLDARRLLEVELIGRVAERRRLEDLLPARRLLEAMLQLPPDAPRPKYVELDVGFHDELCRIAGNEVLATMQRTLMDLLQAQLADMVPTNPGVRVVSDRYHAAIYAAVAAGDAERARREMYEHLSAAYDYILAILQEPPEAKPSTS